MQLRGALIAHAIAFTALLPLPAGAQETIACDTLLRRLGNIPQIIGNTAETRRYTLALSQLNADIRKLRIAMYRNGCGAGSIVTVNPDPENICADMQSDLRAMEAERQEIGALRNEARQMVRPSPDRDMILAALERNGCPSPGLSPLPGNAGTLPGKADIPSAKPYSGITNLRTRKPVEEQKVEAPPPERPYDPNRKVRSVGPQFYPDESDIDLANPASHGPQQTQ